MTYLLTGFRSASSISFLNWFQNWNQFSSVFSNFVILSLGKFTIAVLSSIFTTLSLTHKFFLDIHLHLFNFHFFFHPSLNLSSFFSCFLCCSWSLSFFGVAFNSSFKLFQNFFQNFPIPNRFPPVSLALSTAHFNYWFLLYIFHISLDFSSSVSSVSVKTFFAFLLC